jgi:DNA-binding NarL/FixJ family response regulator
MRLLHHRRPRSGPGPTPHEGGRPPTILPMSATASLPRRLERLRDRTGALELVDHEPLIIDPAPVRMHAHVEVAVIAAADDDPRGVAMVRSLRRAHPGLGLVVVGEGTDWFEDAFDVGADAWVDHKADDDTLLEAIHRSRGSASYRLPRPSSS